MRVPHTLLGLTVAAGLAGDAFAGDKTATGPKSVPCELRVSVSNVADHIQSASLQTELDALGRALMDAAQGTMACVEGGPRPELSFVGQNSVSPDGKSRPVNVLSFSYPSDLELTGYGSKAFQVSLPGDKPVDPAAFDTSVRRLLTQMRDAREAAAPAAQ